MNVGALRRLLDDPSIKDNMLVVVPFADHQYRVAYASVAPAVSEDGGLYEAHGEPKPFGVLVFR